MVSIFLWLMPKALSYSDKTTHPDLTREVIDFYELSGGKKLTDEQKQWIIQGSIDEDMAPRWLNHFYDPVFDRGLDTPTLFVNGYSAKNWGLYSKYQLAKLGQTGTAGVMIAGLSDPSSMPFVFSYEAGLERYAKSKEKDAYLTLGHILHLIEDLTVSEHTRNDPHPGGNMPSYYENWTKDNSSGLTQNLAKRLFVKGNKPVIYSDLESYFNNLATYTNNYFFSPRTINSEIYLKPKIVFEDETFAYGKDENGELFDLAYLTKDFVTQKTIYSVKDENYQVIQEYWLRLSRQAVVNGAGVIQLFLSQAEMAKEAEVARQKIDAGKPKNSLISQILNFFRSPSAPADEPALTITSDSIPAAPKIVKPETAAKPVAVTKPAPTVVPTPTKQTPVITPIPAPAPQNQAPQSGAPMVYGGGGSISSATNGGGGSSSSNTQQTTPVVVAQGDTTGQANNTQQTTFNATSTDNSLNVSTFNAGDLVINEIMYDLEGSDTLSGKSREWVELYNNSGREITLTGDSAGWRFSDGSNHILNEPPTNGSQGSMTIPVSGYAILAGDALTFLADHSGFGGTVIDTVMGLKNTSATLKISAPGGAVIDEVTHDSSWGANGNGKTLERKLASDGSNDAANWAQSSASGGTPGAANNWELLILGINNLATTTSAVATSTPETATSSPQTGLGTDVAATTTISTNTTWALAGSPYRLFFDGQRRPTVAAGAVLTIAPSVKIIPQGGGATAMEIQGALNAVGTAAAPIIFTSINDSDNNASTTPQKGEWLNIAFSQGSQANLDYVEFRYGGGQDLFVPLHEMVNITGATININNSKFENSKHTALRLSDSSGIVQNSVFRDNNCGISVDSINGVANTSYAGCYGIHTTGQILSAAPQIINNQFIRNQLIGIEVRSGTAPSIDNNIFTDNGYPIKIESSYPIITNSQLSNSTTSSSILGGIAISGYTHFSYNFALKNNSQLPYILETSGPALSPYVDVGAILTIEPGTVLKSNNKNPIIFVYGSLIASTTPDNPIVFTSFKDDTRGGDTNGDASASSAQDNDWANIKFLAGSIGSFFNATFSYAGFGFVPHNLLPTNTLAKDFPSVVVSGINPSATSSQWMAEHSYNFNKIVIHKLSTANPENFSYKIGIKDFQNNFIAAVDLSNLQNINESELTVAVQGQFLSGETYYAVIETNDSFSVGQDTDEKLALAFYELTPGLPANPALSIDSGAVVVVQ